MKTNSLPLSITIALLLIGGAALGACAQPSFDNRLSIMSGTYKDQEFLDLSPAGGMILDLPGLAAQFEAPSGACRAEPTTLVCTHIELKPRSPDVLRNLPNRILLREDDLEFVNRRISEGTKGADLEPCDVPGLAECKISHRGITAVHASDLWITYGRLCDLPVEIMSVGHILSASARNSGGPNVTVVVDKSYYISTSIGDVAFADAFGELCEQIDNIENLRVR